jgi:hypothetical protein
MGVVFVGVRADFFRSPFLTTSGHKRGAEFVGGTGGRKAHKTFPHGVSVTRESLSGLKVKTKWVLEGTKHNAMSLPACLPA